MRKMICVLSTLLAIIAFDASLLSAEDVIFGVKGGLSIAKVTGSDADGADWRTAGVVGLFLCYHVNDVLAFQPEALYAMKGEKEEGMGDLGYGWLSYKLTSKLDYFEIPLLLKIYVPTQSKVKPHIFAGPAIAFKVSSKEKVEVGGISVEADLDGVKSTDFGIVAGAGIEYRLASGCILFDARYDAGLTSIDDSASNADLKNSAISIMVGYGFAF